MADLAKLEQKYRAAQEKFSGSGTGRNKASYQDAKAAFAQARTEQRKSDEAAGTRSSLATVTDSGE